MFDLGHVDVTFSAMAALSPNTDATVRTKSPATCDMAGKAPFWLLRPRLTYRLPAPDEPEPPVTRAISGGLPPAPPPMMIRSPIENFVRSLTGMLFVLALIGW